MSYSAIRSNLEKAIQTAKLSLYLVPMVDEFQGEYIPAYAARLPHVSGFTGSAGMGAFWAEPSATRTHTLFVDGRYTIQAAREAEGLAVLNSGDVSLTEWINAQANAGDRIGFDPWLVSEQQLEQWQKATAAKKIEWVAHRGNLVDGIWDAQEVPPAGDVVLQPLDLAGVDYATKRTALLSTLSKHGADGVLLTQPDGINWLLNIRGSDVPFNPLLLAHMLLRADGSAVLFTFAHTLSAAVTDYLAQHQVRVAPLASVFDGSLDALKKGETLLMDASATAHGWFTLAASAGCNVVKAEDPTVLPKAIKNSVELQGIRAAHARDGLALSRLLHWFDARSSAGNSPDELMVVSALEDFRAKDASYRGASFATIAGCGPNGAIVHYRADAASNRKSRPGDIFLLDSGGQYPDGTTDVTRTLFVSSPAGGSPAPAVKEHFTRVLKGHIALAGAKFPAGTSGIQLDVLARQYLWSAGLDYDHGTGHGVGAFLCVHEGPQRISKRGSLVPLVPGMIVSNEPGYYAANQYGIRIESLIAVIETGVAADGKKLLGFETLTLAPIDARLIEVALLSADERNWLNAYHRRVYEAHAPSLDDKARQWLTQATRAI
ncbi:MAG: aminopeptidase P family protein [Pseudomonadota bacterium]